MARGKGKPVSYRPRGRPPKGSENTVTDEIVSAARTLFFDRGYEGTSTDEVAALAQCSKRTLYTRFATKADLFEAVVLKFLDEKRSEVDTPVLGGKNLRERLELMAQRMTETLLKPDILALHFLIHREAMRFPELMLIVERSGRRPSQQVLVEILKEGGVGGDLVFLADQFQFLIHGPVIRHALSGTDGGTETLHQNAKKVVDFFMAAIGVRKSDKENFSTRKANE